MGEKPKQYRIPLIEIAVKPLEQAAVFENTHGEIIPRILPERAECFRVIIFPQTRYSFIEDEVIDPSRILEIV
jgi:hypothetical protein